MRRDRPLKHGPALGLALDFAHAFDKDSRSGRSTVHVTWPDSHLEFRRDPQKPLGYPCPLSGKPQVTFRALACAPVTQDGRLEDPLWEVLGILA